MRSIKEFFRVIYGNKQAFVGMLILTGYVLMATVGANAVKLDMTPHFENRYRAPAIVEFFVGYTGPSDEDNEIQDQHTWGNVGWTDEETEEETDGTAEELKQKKYLLGTDYLGRDIAKQIVEGSRDVLLIGFTVAIFTILIGFIAGATAGFAGKMVDTVIMFIANLLLTVPQFPILLMLAAFVKIKNPLVMGIILAALNWAGLARSVRAQILSLKQRDFITISKVMGLNLPYILFRDIFPNMASYIAINFINSMAYGISSSVGIMMMGFVPYSPTNWGNILNAALGQGLSNTHAVYYILSPMLALIVFQLACVFFANGLDEAMNPRLRDN